MNVQLYEIELLLFGQDVFDVGLELGIFFEDFGAYGALGAGFHLGFGAGGYAVVSLVSVAYCIFLSWHTLS